MQKSYSFSQSNLSSIKNMRFFWTHRGQNKQIYKFRFLILQNDYKGERRKMAG